MQLLWQFSQGVITSRFVVMIICILYVYWEVNGTIVSGFYQARQE